MANMYMFQSDNHDSKMVAVLFPDGLCVFCMNPTGKYMFGLLHTSASVNIYEETLHNHPKKTLHPALLPATIVLVN